MPRCWLSPTGQTRGARAAAASKAHGWGGQQGGHCMISYQWECQQTVVRIIADLKRRNFATWLDLDNMQGSVMDAMSAAVEDAAVMLYCVSHRYKESANCRLECNYGIQQGIDMVPLMMEENYKPTG
eukprot:COSAG01_NODE_343_length_18564_cov_10.381099_2_plen_127_part_00